MNDDAAKATIDVVDLCDRTDAGSGQGETCGRASCPEAPGRRRTLLHPRLDLRGRVLAAVPAVLGRWDTRALLLLVSHPGFKRDEFAWVGAERPGGGDLRVSVYTGLSAESPYLWITEDEGCPGRFLVSLYVGGADGEEPEGPLLVSGCTAERLAADSLRMIASAKKGSPG